MQGYNLRGVPKWVPVVARTLREMRLKAFSSLPRQRYSQGRNVKRVRGPAVCATQATPKRIVRGFLVHYLEETHEHFGGIYAYIAIHDHIRYTADNTATGRVSSRPPTCSCLGKSATVASNKLLGHCVSWMHRLKIWRN